MFSIFKSKPKEPMEVPDCGDIKNHQEWVDQRYPCPNCLAIHIAKQAIITDRARRKDEQDKNEQLAEMIATKVADKLLAARVPTAGIAE
jgi:hypothetical protein